MPNVNPWAELDVALKRGLVHAEVFTVDGLERRGRVIAFGEGWVKLDMEVLGAVWVSMDAIVTWRLVS